MDTQIWLKEGLGTGGIKYIEGTVFNKQKCIKKNTATEGQTEQPK